MSFCTLKKKLFCLVLLLYISLRKLVVIQTKPQEEDKAVLSVSKHKIGVN